MKTHLLLVLLAGASLLSSVQAAEIVKEGKPNAQIVIAADNRPRMATLAALDLRRYIEKISGARLPIVTAPDESAPVKIYVGESPAAAKLGVNSEELQNGAFRIASGPGWLALVGEDKDFVPTKMTGMRRGDQGPIDEWNRLTAGKTKGVWARPAGGEFKFLWTPKSFAESLNGYYGDDAFGLWKAGGNTLNGFWRQDDDGSMSAVSRFLYSLGVRFYMPIELGEVVPQAETIPLPEINETFTPDFPCRYWAYYNYFNFPLEQTLWDRRLGMNEGGGYYSGVHGLTAVHSTEQTKQAHPEFYALVGGVRDTESRGVGTPCFNSEELLQETVNYCRFRFDVMGDKIVDIMPGDGLKACQSEQCIGKTNSELVWGFVNRVATELYKTHPDKLVNCGAYTSYRDAPDTIQKFSPNVMVSIYNYGRATFNDPEKWDFYRANIEKWESKLAPGRIRRGENNLHNGSPSESRRKPIGFPIIFPRAMAKDLVYLKGKSLGEGAEAPQLPGSWKAPGVDHLALYLQARFLMDADQDVDQILDEYYKLFYGPAAAAMQEAFNYAEDNIATKDTSKNGGRSNPTNVPIEVNLRLRKLLENARAKAGATIYGERIAKVISELRSAEEVLAEAEAKKRILAERAKSAPLAIAVRGADLSKARAYPLVIARGEASGEPRKIPHHFSCGMGQRESSPGNHLYGTGHGECCQRGSCLQRRLRRRRLGYAATFLLPAAH